MLQAGIRSVGHQLLALDEHESAVVEPDSPSPGGIGEVFIADFDCLLVDFAEILHHNAAIFIGRTGIHPYPRVHRHPIVVIGHCPHP